MGGVISETDTSVMISWKLSDWAKKQALIAEKETLKNLPDRPNWRGDYKQDRRYFYGNLGELVFLELLLYFDKQFEYKPRYDGKTDSGDFIIYISSKPRILDIKTAARPEHRYLLVNTITPNTPIDTIYLGIKITPPKAEVYGYATKKELKRVDKGLSLADQTLGLILRDLPRVEDFILTLDKGEGIIKLPKGKLL